jgi:ribonucleotide monophosphatase NagD (HAD superfamily)
MRAILFDMDGVLYNSGAAIEGAAEALKWVRAQRIPHLFVTNTSSRGRDALIEKLARFGVPAARDEILTPAAASAQWLRMRGSGPVALFVRPSLRDEFAGLTCVD